jgi:hypothetical protein
MSAFRVSTKHMAEMVKFWFHHTSPQHRFLIHGLARASRLMVWTVLDKANFESIKARYDEELLNPGLESNELTGVPYHPVAVISLARCYDCQSCEFDGWGESTAKKISDDIERVAVSLIPAKYRSTYKESGPYQIPGYEGMPWGI